MWPDHTGRSCSRWRAPAARTSISCWAGRWLSAFCTGSPDPLVTTRIREVCAAPADDGIIFDLAGIQGERIKEDAEYEGVRVRVSASLDGARIAMQVDVGFGDVVDPPPAEITFPVLLPLDAPVLRAYPPEAVIAEKFHAMVVLGIANSRMKDFFDVWALAQRTETHSPSGSCSDSSDCRIPGGSLQADTVGGVRATAGPA